jgi:RNA polymerase sigma-70 factor (ECF subfamily)
MVMGGDMEGEDFDAAFRDLFMPAFRVAYRILGNVADAEDAAAEALARACVKWRRVGSLSYRDAWVMRVTANVAVDMVRRRREPPPATETLSDASDETVRRLAIVGALQSVSRRQREVLALRFIAGLPEIEVAQSLGLSVNSVKTHTARGLAALRARLGDDPMDGSLVLD